MVGKKILFDGCSFTANSGFKEENQCNLHWPHLLTKHYQTEFDNNAIGGSSNEEIFNRVVCATTLNSYDLVLVQWTEISRQWVHYSSNNIDDFTIINAGDPKGYRCKDAEVQQYAKLHYTYFNNRYVNLKKWLCQILALAGYLDSKKQSYIFIKGFENYVSAFVAVDYNNGFENLDLSIKNFLDFDNRPDSYILSKVKDIQLLLQKVQQLNWANFDSQSFFDSKIDVADDNAHPGPESNRLLSEQLICYCNKYNLLINE